MELIELLKVVGVIIVSVFLVNVILDVYHNMWSYPRLAKSKGCGLPTSKHRFPLGISLVTGAAWKFYKHDNNEYMRNTALGGTHTSWSTMGPMYIFITDDPENVKTVLATKFNDYSLGTRYPAFLPLLGKGIFTLSGDGWKHSRTMLRPQFDRTQITHLESIKEHADKMIARLDEARVSNRIVDAQELFHKLTMDTATEFLFGDSTDTLDLQPKNFNTKIGKLTGDDFCESFSRSQSTLAYRVLLTNLYWLADSFQFRKDIKVCKSFVDAFVQKALEKPMEKDEVRDRFVFLNELTKETRDPEVMRDQAFNILLAGRDTTASLMSFMATYLSVHKDVYAKLREAVLADFGTDDSTITFESLKRCQYLNWVLNETLRLHPIVSFNFRQAVKDTILPRGGGPNGDQPVFVEQGSTVAYSPYSMQRHKDYWGDDADEFKPERWADLKNVGWKYLPFNGGPRICLGQQFALTEMGVVWVRLAQTFKDIDSDWTLEKLHRPKMHHRVTISVDGGVPSTWTR